MLFNSKISHKMIKRLINTESQWAIMLIDIDNINKVISTIVSRCQIITLNNITGLLFFLNFLCIC